MRVAGESARPPELRYFTTISAGRAAPHSLALRVVISLMGHDGRPLLERPVTVRSVTVGGRLGCGRLGWAAVVGALYTGAVRGPLAVAFGRHGRVPDIAL